MKASRTAAASACAARALHQEDELERLAQLSPRLALLVQTSSSRSDVRVMRARLLRLLLGIACPEDVAPRRSWYVPGAVARFGLWALRQVWEHTHGVAPCERTLRRHLAALEDCLAIVRQPGDRIPSLRRPGKAPRYPDTLHLLTDERDARWWERVGGEVLRRHPGARVSPERWEALFGQWRARARSRQLELFHVPRAPIAMPGCEPVPTERAAAQAAAQGIAQALRGRSLDLLVALSKAGVHAPPSAQAELLRSPERTRRAAALFALALGRGDLIRSGWGWVRAAMRGTSREEGQRALARLGADRVGGVP